MKKKHIIASIIIGILFGLFHYVIGNYVVTKSALSTSPRKMREVFFLAMRKKIDKELFLKKLSRLNIKALKENHVATIKVSKEKIKKVERLWLNIETAQKHSKTKPIKEVALLLQSTARALSGIALTYGIKSSYNTFVFHILAALLGFVSSFMYFYSSQIYSRIFVGMIGGAIFGIIFGAFASSGIAILGTIFIRLIKMVVIPLVFASLALGVLSLGDVRKIGKIGVKTMCYYIVTTALAISIGLILANIIQPGKQISKDAQTKYLKRYKQKVKNKFHKKNDKLVFASKIGKLITISYPFDNEEEKEQFFSNYLKEVEENFEPERPKNRGLKDMLIGIVPTNPIKAMTDGKMLQIIFMALLFGLVLSTVAVEKRETIAKGLDGVNDAMITLIGWIMKFAPFGVWGLISITVAQAGTDILHALFIYMLVVIAGLILHILIVYSSAVYFFAKIPIFTFLGKIKPVLLLAFSTSSSAATLPVTMKCAEDEFGVSKGVSSFVLPLGATMNMDGTALYQGVAAVFIAQVFGIPLDLGGQLTILFTATLASIGTAAVPGAGMIILAMVLESVGIPLVGVALIIGVDRILDMCRTAVNVAGDLSATLFVNATELE